MPDVASVESCRPSLQEECSRAPAYLALPRPGFADLDAENRKLHEENAWLKLVLQSAVDYAIITMDIHGCITSWNTGACHIFGYTEAEVVCRSGDIVFTSEDRADGKFTVELCRAIETGRAVNERWHLRRDGTRLWASGLMMPLLSSDGQPHGFLNILRDRTAVRAEADRRELMMIEMNHRVKNTLTTVQAVAAQTGRHAATVDEFRAAFDERLAALARSHEVLIRGRWEDAPLREVLEGAFSAYDNDHGRIALDGTAVLLPANLVVVFTLAFHELATNAAKHGALSVPDGAVIVAWKINSAGKGARRVDIAWCERGGPPVQPPARRGFGTNLLEKILGSQSGITVRRDFRRQGLECHIGVPIGQPATTAQASQGRR